MRYGLKTKRNHHFKQNAGASGGQSDSVPTIMSAT
jgi:hypothetical protein